MQDLELPVLTPRVVSGLTGLSPETLRRWKQQKILTSPRGPGSSHARTLYSWRDVERLQQARYLVKTRRLPMREVKRLLERSQAASLDVDRIVVRPRPTPRTQSRARDGGSGGRRFSKIRAARTR